MERGCGILLPISSLPSKRGFGCFSDEAYRFVDYLADLGMKYWQVLPLGGVDIVGSPYSSVSAFAGEPLYIDIERVLTDEEIDYFKLTPNLPFTEFRARKTEALRYVFDKLYYKTNIDKFIEENEDWVYDYAVYMVLKDELGVTWSEFPPEYKNIDSVETIEFIKEHSEEIVYYIFLQYLFFEQWKELKDYANSKGIKIIGDVPIYCSMDSVDMYDSTKIFMLDENGRPSYVSGVPGDYFTPEGQIWNNPLYDYDYMKSRRFQWWVLRMKQMDKLYDYIRIDHFRGLESYFAVPYGDTNVSRGVWFKGPGMDLFNEFKKNKINNLIAEDLGEISEAVRDLKKQAGLPGMKVMQFAFDGDPDNIHLPHKYEKNCVAYLGTHDNNTFMGLLSEDKLFKNRVCEYFHIPYSVPNEVVTRMAIENLVSTNANVCIITMQDILLEGSSARINTPGTNRGNWQYHLDADYDKNRYNRYLKQLIKLKNR